MFTGKCGSVDSPDAGRHAGVRGVTFLIWTFAEVGEAVADHCLAFVKHEMKPIIGQLDEDEEDGGEGAVDAQSHGGRGQSLWKEVQLCSYTKL